MRDLPPDLVHRLRLHRQDHLLTGWERLSPTERYNLVAQLSGIDLDEIDRLYQGRNKQTALPTPERIAPVPMERIESVSAREIAQGEEALIRGELAIILVAGGQGSRLGSEKPKGMYPIGPMSGKSLFQIHAEKVFALRRRYGNIIPFLIMTSPATHADTELFFAEHNFFGLPRSEVTFFQQGTMPAVDLNSGKLLLESPGQIYLSPNGHGGTLTALAESGLLDDLRQRGVRTIFYFQVDNPLVKIADPAFLGRHLLQKAEVSSKAIEKSYPAEKMGVLAVIDGRCGIIEYSDMPEALLHATSKEGPLLHRAGSPAIHLFDVEFLVRITQGGSQLPYHYAHKKVPHIDAQGRPVNPEKENALKFERFIFDALPLADRWCVLESKRSEEFAPVKNASGNDSPESCKRAMVELVANWMEKAGVKPPRDTGGNSSILLEVSPRFALDEKEFASRLVPGRTIDTDTYFD